MSIVASVAVHDALVLGAESMVQIWGKGEQGQSGVIKTYENAQKLFRLGNHNIGVMTYGIGNIGSRSIGSYLSEFAQKHATNVVKDNADNLLKFLKEKYDEHHKGTEEGQLPALGIMIGGYGPDQHLPESWEFVIPAATAPKLVRERHNFGSSWRGVSAPFSRLFNGFDPRLRQDLQGAGLAPEKIGEVIGKYRMPVVFDGMPVQEAIDFVVFILETTIGMAKFEVGPPSCGGPLWIAVVRWDSFTWVRKPELKAEVQL